MPMRRRPPWARTALQLNAAALCICAFAAAAGAFVSGRSGDLGISIACIAVAALSVFGALTSLRESEK
ncbi:hypothetical protein [Aeromicrobium alkaliterrae]|uniref:Uncharacterized protein n=1 Tax=Aeromicrobium alkaliterrae TaxID=302168 RepID=A0ABN2JGE5_9ACTN